MNPAKTPSSVRLALTALLVVTSLVACAPRTRTPAATPTPPPVEQPQAEPEVPAEAPTQEAPRDTIVLTDPVALETDRAAREAFHLMELAYLETGAYSANVLLTDLELPRGAQWRVEDISETSYLLRITSDALPEVAWFITPEGVVARQVEDNRIY